MQEMKEKIANLTKYTNYFMENSQKNQKCKFKHKNRRWKSLSVILPFPYKNVQVPTTQMYFRHMYVHRWKSPSIIL